MSKQIHKPQESEAKLLQAEVLVSQGQTAADAIRLLGVTELKYFSWRNEVGG